MLFKFWSEGQQQLHRFPFSLQMMETYCDGAIDIFGWNFVGNGLKRITGIDGSSRGLFIACIGVCLGCIVVRVDGFLISRGLGVGAFGSTLVGVSGFVIRSTSSECECGERGASGCCLNEFKSRCGVFHARGVGHEIFPIGFGVLFRASSAKLPLGEKRVYIPWTALTSPCCR